jgi:integrase/recombinase XerD
VLRASTRKRLYPADVRALCDAPGVGTLKSRRDTALLHTLASSGVRSFELVMMQDRDIMAHGGTFLVTVRGKGGDLRDCCLSGEAYSRIQSWLAHRQVDSLYLFTSFAGRGERPTERPMSTRAVRVLVAAYAERVGLRHVSPHGLRRFVGSELARHNLRDAQMVLGHQDITTTARHYILDGIRPGLTDGLY